jgi:hypothetical protein
MLSPIKYIHIHSCNSLSNIYILVCIQTSQKAKNINATQYAAMDNSTGVNYRPQPSYETKKRAQILREDIDGVVELQQPVGGEDSESEGEN